MLNSTKIKTQIINLDENEFDDFSFADFNINEVFDEMGRQLMEMWLDQRRIKERILEIEMRYGMHKDEDVRQMDLF